MDTKQSDKLCIICGFNSSYEDGMCQKCKGVFGSPENVPDTMEQFYKEVDLIKFGEETPVDPTDWRARALKAEAALVAIDDVTNMRMNDYYKSYWYLTAHWTYEHYVAMQIDQALASVADVIRANKETRTP